MRSRVYDSSDLDRAIWNLLWYMLISGNCAVRDGVLPKLIVDIGVRMP